MRVSELERSEERVSSVEARKEALACLAMVVVAWQASYTCISSSR